MSALLVLLMAGMPAVASPVFVERIKAPAALRIGGETVKLAPGRTIEGETTVVTGGDGRARLLSGEGLRLEVGADTELHLVPGADQAVAAGAGVLLKGQLRARAGDRAKPIELHLNVGRLRIRLRGAEVWLEKTPAVETVCLLSGHVDIRSELDVPWSISRPGYCLVVEPDGSWWENDASANGVLERKLAATGFPSAAVAPARVKSQALKSAPSKAPAASDARRWTVVIGSFADERNALRFAASLAGRLGELSVLPVPDGGDTVYRVCLGDYEARARAERLRDDMRVDYPGVWVAPR